MPMQIRPMEKGKTHGAFILIYGPEGSGKTLNTMLTAPRPLLVINTEARDPEIVWENIGAPEGVELVNYTNFEDCREFLTKTDLSKYSTIFFDSFTYLMQVSMSEEIAAEAYRAREKKKTVDKPMASELKLTQEGYGVLATAMARILDFLGTLVREQAKIVICSAREDSTPKWNVALAGAPMLEGKRFVKIMAGSLDVIGRVEKRYEQSDDGVISPVYPPLVTFEGGGFMCRWRGPHKKDKQGRDLIVQGPLDFTAILGLMQGSK